MKSFYYFAILFVVCMLAQDALTQTRTRRTAEEESNNAIALPELSVRAKAKNESQTVNVDNMVWLRVLYREIDLKKEANAPLYYPTEPIGDRMNLFTLIFKLLIDKKLTAYEYLDGREIFTDQYKLDIEKWLKDKHFVHKKTGTGATAVFKVDDIDIPSNEVSAYMIKEANYFDQATGTFGTEIIAICPMQDWEGDYGENNRIPLCWIPYENLRPYISRSLIMTSNYNNALTYTTDDFFQLKMYKGDIIKTVNMMNYTMAQQFPDSAKLKHAQDSIEKQLKDFEKQLWIAKKKEQTAVAGTKNKKEEKATKTDTKSPARATRSSANVKSSASKSSSPKTTSSSPTKSVRRK